MWCSPPPRRGRKTVPKNADGVTKEQGPCGTACGRFRGSLESCTQCIARFIGNQSIGSVHLPCRPNHFLLARKVGGLLVFSHGPQNDLVYK